MFDIGTLPPEFLFSHQSVPKSRLATASPREKRFGCSRTSHLFVHRGGFTRDNCEPQRGAAISWYSFKVCTAVPGDRHGLRPRDDRGNFYP